MAKTAAKGFSPLVEFARKGGPPVHVQITESLRQSIMSGRILPGARQNARAGIGCGDGESQARTHLREHAHRALAIAAEVEVVAHVLPT